MFRLFNATFSPVVRETAGMDFNSSPALTICVEGTAGVER